MAGSGRAVRRRRHEHHNRQRDHRRQRRTARPAGVAPSRRPCLDVACPAVTGELHPVLSHHLGLGDGQRLVPRLRFLGLLHRLDDGARRARRRPLRPRLAGRLSGASPRRSLRGRRQPVQQSAPRDPAVRAARLAAAAGRRARLDSGAGGAADLDHPLAAARPGGRMAPARTPVPGDGGAGLPAADGDGHAGVVLTADAGLLHPELRGAQARAGRAGGRLAGDRLDQAATGAVAGADAARRPPMAGDRHRRARRRRVCPDRQPRARRRSGAITWPCSGATPPSSTA